MYYQVVSKLNHMPTKPDASKVELSVIITTRRLIYY